MIAEAYTTLDQLPVRSVARVLRLIAPPAVEQRLSEMGLTPGTEIRVIRTAPLGDPVQVAVRDYRLTMRRSQARCIVVA